MHRALGLAVLACPRCGGRLRLVATLQDPAVVRAFLAHLPVAPGLDLPAPPTWERQHAREDRPNSARAAGMGSGVAAG